MRSGRLEAWLLGAAVAAVAAMGGCTTTTVPAGLATDPAPARPSAASGSGYFVVPDAGDPWSAPVARWQRRARADSAAPSPVSAGWSPLHGPDASTSSLSESFTRFRAERKRSVARDVTTWIQEQAHDHFIPDGPVDRWATFEETLARGGDDCDGLSLVAYRMMRDLGFGEGELYQAIVYKLEDDQHHMVTLWFEDRDDPWVIDPTAAMVGAMVRMSRIPGWRAIKIFSESEEYTVRLPETPAVATPPPASDTTAN